MFETVMIAMVCGHAVILTKNARIWVMTPLTREFVVVDIIALYPKPLNHPLNHFFFH
jgi:hypothetical protein